MLHGVLGEGLSPCPLWSICDLRALIKTRGGRISALRASVGEKMLIMRVYIQKKVIHERLTFFYR